MPPSISRSLALSLSLALSSCCNFACGSSSPPSSLFPLPSKDISELIFRLGVRARRVSATLGPGFDFEGEDDGVENEQVSHLPRVAEEGRSPIVIPVV